MHLNAPALLAALALASCSGAQKPPEGCSKDTDCLGGRICGEAKRCVEPPPGSAAIVEEPEPDAGPGDPIVGPPAFAMFGGDTRHTGALAGPSPRTQPKEIWRYQAGGPIVGSPTVGPDGTIYVASHDKSLHALSADGSALWTFATGDRLWSTPAVAVDGTVYTGSDDDHLYAIDGKTGSEKWRLRIGNCKDPLGFGPEGSRCDADGGPTIGPQGTIYVGGDGVYAVWPNGTIRWKFATPEHVSTAPALSEAGYVFSGCLDDVVYAIRPDGTKEWSYRTTRDVESSPALGADGEVYIGGDDDSVYAFTKDGELAWRVITGGDVRASPAIDSEGNIYVGSYDHKLYAISKKGAVKWRFETAGKIHGSVGIAQNGVLLFGSQDDHLYALDMSGRLLWFVDFGSDVDSPPVITSDGTLLVAGDDGTVRAYK